MHEVRDIGGSVKQYKVWRNGQGVVHCQRFNGKIYLTLKPIPVHSPTGFEFGYGGSGPAELALCILTDYAGREKANHYYQRFKWDKIATRKGDFTITDREIEEWIKGVENG